MDKFPKRAYNKAEEDRRSEYHFKRWKMSANFNRFIRKVLEDLTRQLGISWDSSSFEAGYSEEELRKSITQFMEVVSKRRGFDEGRPVNYERLEKDLQDHVEGSGTGPGGENIVIELNGMMRLFGETSPAHYKLTIDGVTLRQDELESISKRIDSDEYMGEYRGISSDKDWE